MIRPFYFSDEIFYWARIGNRPTVLEFQCILAGEAEPKALREALLKALQVHTNFRARPVVSGGQFYSKIEDVGNPPLYEEDGRKRRLGTDETEGLLLYATYKGRVISLHVFHGLSDFRGINAFINTMLKFYFSSLGLAEVELPEPDSADTIPCFEDLLKRGAPGDTIGYFVPKEEDVFHIPEKNFGKWTTMQHICEIDVPLEPLLALSRSSESTIVQRYMLSSAELFERPTRLGTRSLSAIRRSTCDRFFILRPAGMHPLISPFHIQKRWTAILLRRERCFCGPSWTYSSSRRTFMRE